VAKLFSISYAAGHVFSNWKSVVVKLVPKVPIAPLPQATSDLLSVTPQCLHVLQRELLLKDDFSSI